VSRLSLPGWVSLAGRLILAGVLGYAALSKITDPAATVRAVRAYQILPDGVAVPFGHALPWVELVVAVLLLAGFAVRAAGVAATILMAMFVIGIASASARGLRIDCGCFGGGGVTAHPHYMGELIRDGLLLALSVAVAVIPHSRLAVDPQLAELQVPPEATSRQQKVAANRFAAEKATVARRLRLNTGVAAALVVVMAVIGIGAGHSSATAANLVTPTAATAAGGIVVGQASAPHHIIAYEDPQCPICGEFESASGATVEKAVVEGKVSVEYRMMSFLGPESVRAVAALGAAAQGGKFEQLRAALFAHQPEERTGGFTIATLIELGKSVGRTDAAYTTAVTKQTYAPWARTVENAAEKAGITGTPTVLLDGKALDLQSVLLQPTVLAKALGLS
jgi:protein-disulfide isomerase